MMIDREWGLPQFRDKELNAELAPGLCVSLGRDRDQVYNLTVGAAVESRRNPIFVHFHGSSYRFASGFLLEVRRAYGGNRWAIIDIAGADFVLVSYGSDAESLRSFMTLQQVFHTRR